MPPTQRPTLRNPARLVMVCLVLAVIILVGVITVEDSRVRDWIFCEKISADASTALPYSIVTARNRLSGALVVRVVDAAGTRLHEFHEPDVPWIHETVKMGSRKTRTTRSFSWSVDARRRGVTRPAVISTMNAVFAFAGQTGDATTFDTAAVTIRDAEGSVLFTHSFDQTRANKRDRFPEPARTAGPWGSPTAGEGPR